MAMRMLLFSTHSLRREDTVAGPHLGPFTLPVHPTPGPGAQTYLMISTGSRFFFLDRSLTKLSWTISWLRWGQLPTILPGANKETRQMKVLSLELLRFQYNNSVVDSFTQTFTEFLSRVSHCVSSRTERSCNFCLAQTMGKMVFKCPLSQQSLKYDPRTSGNYSDP